METRDITERQTLTIEEVATVLGIGRNSAYQAVATGRIPVLRLGRRLLVPRAALDRLLAETKATRSDRPERRPFA